MSKHNSVLGLLREITPDTLHTFENRYGCTPDALQLAFQNLAGNTKGYFAPKEILTRPGQRIEADYFEPKFNDIDYSATADPFLPQSLRNLRSSNPLGVRELHMPGLTATLVMQMAYWLRP